MNVAERRKEAMQLRGRGFTLQEIARQIGCSHSTVRRDLRLGLKAIPKSMVDKLTDGRTQPFAGVDRHSIAREVTL